MYCFWSRCLECWAGILPISCQGSSHRRRGPDVCGWHPWWLHSRTWWGVPITLPYSFHPSMKVEWEMIVLLWFRCHKVNFLASIECSANYKGKNSEKLVMCPLLWIFNLPNTISTNNLVHFSTLRHLSKWRWQIGGTPQTICNSPLFRHSASEWKMVKYRRSKPIFIPDYWKKVKVTVQHATNEKMTRVISEFSPINGG